MLVEVALSAVGKMRRKIARKRTGTLMEARKEAARELAVLHLVSVVQDSRIDVFKAMSVAFWCGREFERGAVDL